MGDQFMRIVTDYKHAHQIIIGLDAEIERLTAQLKATEANEQVLADANKPLLERIAELEAALDKLARLGNEPHYGNSDGNVIAQKALAKGEQANEQ